MARERLTQRLLEREATTRRDLRPTEYDLALCRMFDDINTAPPSAERVEALLALASATLRRNGPILTESRAYCAEHLLALLSSVSEPALHLRIRLLFLLAWLQLGTVVARGPESISKTPDLPPGIALPYGVDPEEISDPALREQAREMAVLHSEAVERWNAKQRALLLPDNRYRNRIKILYWDRDGFCIWYKRLERGVFELPSRGPVGVELDHQQLSRLLGGLDLRSGRRRQRRYRRVIVAKDSCGDALP
jgi:hypothetical protein